MDGLKPRASAFLPYSDIRQPPSNRDKDTTMKPPSSPSSVVKGRKPYHPYWCDECGHKAPFTIPGCPIEHSKECPREGEDAMRVYNEAKQYVQATGEPIP